MGKGLINGGFFVFNKLMLSYLTKEKDCDFEFGPLQELVKNMEQSTLKGLKDY